MLLTGSLWFWINFPWLFMQACSRIQAGRCEGRVLHGQQTGVPDMIQILSLSVPTVQVPDQLCA